MGAEKEQERNNNDKKKERKRTRRVWKCTTRKKNMYSKWWWMADNPMIMCLYLSTDKEKCYLDYMIVHLWCIWATL